MEEMTAAETLLAWIEDTFQPQFTGSGDYAKWREDFQRMIASVQSEAVSGYKESFFVVPTDYTRTNAWDWFEKDE